MCPRFHETKRKKDEYDVLRSGNKNSVTLCTKRRRGDSDEECIGRSKGREISRWDGNKYYLNGPRRRRDPKREERYCKERELNERSVCVERRRSWEGEKEEKGKRIDELFWNEDEGRDGEDYMKGGVDNASVFNWNEDAMSVKTEMFGLGRFFDT